MKGSRRTPLQNPSRNRSSIHSTGNPKGCIKTVIALKIDIIRIL
jgi:hypothetical protein